MTCQGDRLARAVAFSVGEVIDTRQCDGPPSSRVIVRLGDEGFTAEYRADLCDVCERFSHQLAGFDRSSRIRRDT